jgi:hypothetical protein
MFSKLRLRSSSSVDSVLGFLDPRQGVEAGLVAAGFDVEAPAPVVASVEFGTEFKSPGAEFESLGAAAGSELASPYEI